MVILDIDAKFQFMLQGDRTQRRPTGGRGGPVRAQHLLREARPAAGRLQGLLWQGTIR